MNVLQIHFYILLIANFNIFKSFNLSNILIVFENYFVLYKEINHLFL